MAARFGQPLRYPSHCDALEVELREATTDGRRLSPSTLRRFFGLVGKEGGYHLHTLDTLARYAGHTDFADFGQAVTRQAEANPTHPTDIPELLAMEQLAHPERLLLGYFLGRITRPAVPTAPAAPLALRLAAHPAGQQYFVESFVDLAYLNGAYGQVVAEYLRHKPTPQAQLFGHCALFLGEFLAQNEPAWRRCLAQLRALPVPADVHAFPRGRRAFAELVAAWHDAPANPQLGPLLAQFRQEAGALPRPAVPTSPLPAFYNLFPAGFHFLVAEALFLTGQFADLRGWVELIWADYPEVAHLEHNVYAELLHAFGAVANQRLGLPAVAPTRLRGLFALDSHSWLLDYYRVHFWLAELHFATEATKQQQLQELISTFAHEHGMPLFRTLANQLVPASGR
ncbi:hypothetical protein CDA63_06640 [Hymenobacter amundsenii]|uniref:Uncharacterized protein n=1 Tax=Hymenobacter amundsenii TaxID=2006685 RepID=A0A246FMB1_9BACT|nr:hypothetical protein [Hymenobacter amundsenii]OWP63885.1 hypothetical protein CDA63_06640 [Hymenobacter amundsenii]